VADLIFSALHHIATNICTKQHNSENWSFSGKLRFSSIFYRTLPGKNTSNLAQKFSTIL